MNANKILQESKKFRKDYQKPPFEIKHVNLDVELSITIAKISIELEIQFQHQTNKPSTIKLDGDIDNFQQLYLNNTLWKDYQLEKDYLVVNLHHQNNNSQLRVKIITHVNPQENKSPEGIFVSDGVILTHCEPAGFHKFTYFLDRPDVLSTYHVTLRAKRCDFPTLLSNGEPISSSELSSGLHQVTWDDPIPKPCYLFAIVAGDLVNNSKLLRNTENNITVNVWSKKNVLHETNFLLETICNVIDWDQNTNKLKYGRSQFNAVIVDNFNSGAMENSGLNIFDSNVVLTNPKYTLDEEYGAAETIAAHEYLHNWSGNRVTIRDWFELTLKEGLTVFRDQEFTARNMDTVTSKAAHRIKTIMSLRNRQFKEDKSLSSHPIRADSYSTTSALFTGTVYSKGAEVVRMLKTLLSAPNFQNGLHYFFEEWDGQAATCDDFIRAFTAESGRNLDQFINWYESRGTPIVDVFENYDPHSMTYEVTLQQQKNQADKGNSSLLLIPITIKLLPGKRTIEKHEETKEQVLELSKKKQTFTFYNVRDKPILSINRSPHAPLIIKQKKTTSETLCHLLEEDDPIVCWDLTSKIYESIIINGTTIPNVFIHYLNKIIENSQLNHRYRALLLTLPSSEYLSQKEKSYDPITLFHNRSRLQKLMGQKLKKTLNRQYTLLSQGTSKRHMEEDDRGKRYLKNTCLDLLCAGDAAQAELLARTQYETNENYTDEWRALVCLIRYGSDNVEKLLLEVSEKYRGREKILSRLIGLHTLIPKDPSETPQSYIDTLDHLISKEFFNKKYSVDTFSLIDSLRINNPIVFHALDGSGYKFWISHLISLDKQNPKLSAQLIRIIDDSSRWTMSHRTILYQVLDQNINSINTLSPNTRNRLEEILSALRDNY